MGNIRRGWEVVKGGLRARRVAAAALLMMACSRVYAELPTPTAPGAASASDGDWLNYIQEGFKNGVQIIGYLVAAGGLVMVVWKCIQAYQEVGAGRAGWGDVATAATGGAFIMMLGVAVITIAVAVFP